MWTFVKDMTFIGGGVQRCVLNKCDESRWRRMEVTCKNCNIVIYVIGSEIRTVNCTSSYTYKYNEALAR